MVGDPGTGSLGERDRGAEAEEDVADDEALCWEGRDTERGDVRRPHGLLPVAHVRVAVGEEGLVDRARLEQAERGCQHYHRGPTTPSAARDLADEQRGTAVERGEEDDGERDRPRPSGRVVVGGEQFGTDGAEEEEREDRERSSRCDLRA